MYKHIIWIYINDYVIISGLFLWGKFDGCTSWENIDGQYLRPPVAISYIIYTTEGIKF